jgi:hypothetical protein
MSFPKKQRAKRASDVNVTAEARAAAWERRVAALGRSKASRTRVFRTATAREWSRKAAAARAHKRGSAG